MPDRAAVFEDRVPYRVAVLGFGDEQFFEIGVLDDEAARQRLVGIDVGGDGFDAGAGAAGDDRDARSGSNRHLARKALHDAHVGGIGAGAAFGRQIHRRLIDLGADVLEHFQVPRLGHGAFEGQPARLIEAVQAHDAKADGTFAFGGIFGACHFGFGAVDVILQHIVEEAHAIFDEAGVGVPLVPGFEVERRQAADRGAVIAEMVRPGGQGDFGTQVGRADLQPQIALVLGHGAVHFIDEDDVGLAGRQPGFDQLGEQAAGIDLTALFAGFGADEVEGRAIAHRCHEVVGDEDAVV